MSARDHPDLVRPPDGPAAGKAVTELLGDVAAGGVCCGRRRAP